MTLKVFLDFMSQPSRALLLFVRATSIPHEVKPIRIAKMEHKSPEFTKMSKFQTVPIIDDNGVVIRDSSAILRYLSQTRKIDSHWYPADPEGQARIDEYLHWQHLNTRAGCAMYFRTKWLIPTLKQEFPDEAKVAEKLKTMNKALDDIEQKWLEGGNKKYIAGGDKISVADIMAVCELEQPSMAGFDVTEGRPVLKEYRERIISELGPHYDEVNKVLYQMRDKFGGKIPVLEAKL